MSNSTADPVAPEETYQQLFESATEFFDEFGYTSESREEFLDITAENARDGQVKQWPPDVLNRAIDAAMLKPAQPLLFKFYELMVKQGEQSEYKLIAASGLSQATVNRRLNTLKELGLVQYTPPVPATWKVE